MDFTKIILELEEARNEAERIVAKNPIMRCVNIAFSGYILYKPSK